MKKIFIILLMVAALATAAQAAPVTGFINLDFDDNTQNIIGGFDMPAYNIPGWQDYNPPLVDSGSEKGAWWPTKDGYAAFCASTDGAYNTSSYVIQTGDAFVIDFWGMQWEWTSTGVGQWTVTLYYDNPANVIGQYVANGLPNNGSYREYTSPVIPATVASEGGLLGILIVSTGGDIVQIDEITIVTIPLVNNSPANGAPLISPVRTNADNDLVFTVYDPDITKVDVQLGTENDPNLTTKATYKIVDDLAVTPGQYTVDLESELTSDLLYETTYYWKVIGYTDSNSVPGPVWSFTTAPEDPLITIDPDPFTAVDAGEPNIVLSANGINGNFKWYKGGSPIDDTVGVYAGTTTNTLTIYDVQLADEGYYTLKVSSVVGEDVSEPGRVMIHRQTSYYTFDAVTVVDSNNVFADSMDGYHAVLKQESASAGWPTSKSDANSIPGLGAYLYLNNADHATDPNGQYLQIYPGVADYEDITITFWAQSTAVRTWTRLLDFGSGVADYLFITPDFGSSYDPRFATRINNGTEQRLQPDLNSGNWIGPGTGWHFVAVTIGGNTGKMYTDGEWRVTNTGMTINPIDVGAVLNYIGKSQYTADPEFSGYIDDLKIWNYALTNEQVAQEYMAVTGDPYICDTENNDVWRYDQGWEADGVWIGGNNNCKLDLADFAGMAARWLESDQFTL